ncbi:2-hydroxyhepta-2,4-diene-1,7-dioate isomerase [Paraburkholderia phytofirmans OLGA172]|uniref:2-hydroxyhepta-2,4-diene-1,7-dioate isomerase n=1 Tax=Paraburkholderia phytofirmans OLGA172 TaxID=1417228 RepID=A0A161HPK3_9BURK|nr:fumarylacetoacetate hydrolase family protein [Paraburkholderia phytofirmans]ANB74997.1 2-hydroxyhepta-2,4-diene-1,7-dioate isomerase [Paraburkholderia phytofirmans OLGA172]
MKICRFDDDRLGVVEGDSVRDVTAALDVLPLHRYPLPTVDPLIANLAQVADEIRRIAPSAPLRPLADVRLLSPVANPGKVVAAPVNYKKHLEEARAQVEVHHNNQVAEIQKIGLFLKATSSIVSPAAGVELQHLDRRNDHEAELAVIIGKTGRNITQAQAFDYVAGYAVGLDMTARGPEERSLRKSIDSFTVLGPWMVTADEVADPSNIDFWLTVNGQPRQKANTKDLILGIAELIEFASSFYTLHPGDILLTGTPEGVGPVLPGDTIDCAFDGVGQIRVAVRAADGATGVAATTPETAGKKETA